MLWVISGHKSADFCFPPKSGHGQCRNRCLLSANNRHSHESLPTSPLGSFVPRCVPNITVFSGKERYESWLEKFKQGAGDFDACLHSLRHHPLGSCWSRRLLGPSRKGRRGRAIEARLDGDEIASNHFISACLPLRQSQPRSNPLNRGFFRVYLPDEPRAQCCASFSGSTSFTAFSAGST
jgi:hypothetical protein